MFCKKVIAQQHGEVKNLNIELDDRTKKKIFKVGKDTVISFLALLKAFSYAY